MHAFVVEILYIFVMSKQYLCRYTYIGDIAHVGTHPPNVAAVYRKIDGFFALPMGYDLVRLYLMLIVQITFVPTFISQKIKLN